ncbi:unnamed protein product, partial [Adineta ricciae]
DHGNYYCLPDSTFCADGYFEWAGPCNTSNGDKACPDGFCCVHDNYYSDKQFVCLKCKNSVALGSCPAASSGSGPAQKTNAPAVVPPNKDKGNDKHCCAASCSGSYKAGSTADTCSLKCNDHGNYYCLPDSTFCADGYFEWAGPCNTSNGDKACPDGFCCV